jgi:hypothetical protein
MGDLLGARVNWRDKDGEDRVLSAALVMDDAIMALILWGASGKTLPLQLALLLVKSKPEDVQSLIAQMTKQEMGEEGAAILDAVATGGMDALSEHQTEAEPEKPLARKDKDYLVRQIMKQTKIAKNEAVEAVDMLPVKVARELLGLKEEVIYVVKDNKLMYQLKPGSEK